MLDSLIDEILEVTEAKRFSIEVPDSEVDNSYSAVATRMGIDTPKLTQMLASDGASADTLKRRFAGADCLDRSCARTLTRRAWKSGTRMSKRSSQLHKPDGKKTTWDTNTSCGPSFSSCRAVRPTPLTKPANVTPKPCARAFRTATTALRLLALSGTSRCATRCRNFPPTCAQPLREILDSTAVGHLTPPETTAEGVQMFAICAKKETKSDTPEMREIRDQMLQQKFGAKAKRYLENLRRAAMIEYKMTEDK